MDTPEATPLTAAVAAPRIHGTQLRSLRAFYAEAFSHLITSHGLTSWHYVLRLSVLDILHPSAPADIQEVISKLADLPLGMDTTEWDNSTAALADQARTAVEFASGAEILGLDFNGFTAALTAAAAPAPGPYLVMLQANAAAALNPDAAAPAPGYGIPEDAEPEMWTM